MSYMTFLVFSFGFFLGLSRLVKTRETEISSNPGKSYDGFVVFEFRVENEDRLRKLQKLLLEISQDPLIDVFPHPYSLATGRLVSVVVPPSRRLKLRRQILRLLRDDKPKRGPASSENESALVERDLSAILRSTFEDEAYLPTERGRRSEAPRHRRRRSESGNSSMKYSETSAEETEPTSEPLVDDDSTTKMTTTKSTTTRTTTTKTPTSKTTTKTTTTTKATTPTTTTLSPSTEEPITTQRDVPDIVGRWARLEEIEDWLDALANQHPSLVSIFYAGRSEEGRILKGVVVGRRDQKAPVIWIHAGIHAREWIAPATAVHFLDKLVKNRDEARIKKLLDEVQFHVLPVANPDGYVYSMDCDRLWRKNMKGGSTKYCCRSGEYCFSCFGVDLNRNWNMAFNKIGVSPWPCDQTFPGPFAFSESETRSIGYTIQVMSPRVKAFLTLHSYGQIWAMPWVHSPDPTDDFEDLFWVSKNGTDLVSSVYGSKWTYGPGYFSVYPIGGCSMDWAKRDGIKYSFTLELRPHVNTTYPFGFVRPSTDIVPSGEEVWPGIIFVAEKVAEEWEEEKRKKNAMGDQP